ncbi:major capsid hexamer protein [Gordonia phage Lilbeanie]|uniref:Major capsid hexamer protein n=1 Tax=Gordonia phage Lilbeanie TaxID=2794947 RepID=A0A7T1KS89_9CAUD|nr:major head protein [Gordonia phage Lilbeanie]QPO17096.1 major capsid hexamer protein [Gordonia phage Lilbeanie]
MPENLKDLLKELVDAAQADDVTTDEQRHDVIAKMLEGKDRETVDALQNEAIAQYSALDASDPSDDTGLTGLKVLVQTMKVTREFQTKFADADEAKRALREALAKDVEDIKAAQPAAEKSGEEQKPDETKDGGEAKGAETTSAEGEKTPEAGEPGGGETSGAESAPEGGNGGAGAETGAEAGADMVVASGKAKFSLDSIPKGGGSGKPKETLRPEDAKPGVEILVASGVRDHEGGDKLPDLKSIAAAAQSRINSFPRGARGAIMKGDVASFHIPFDKELVASAHDAQDVIDRAGDVNGRFGSGKALVAAGGWCAPSTTLYDIPQSFTDASAGLVDVAEIQVTRGGVRFRPAPDFGAIYGSGKVGQVQTEAEAGSADPEDYTKSFFRIPCDDFDDHRADVIYTGIEAGILQNHAYPEQTEAYVSEVIAAHAHRVNAETLLRMEADSTPLNLSTAFGPGAAGSINALEWVIVNERYRLRASETTLLSVVLPIHFQVQIRADIANRAGGANIMEVTNEQINAWFAARGARVQWVYDWQDALVTANGVGVGSNVIGNAYPTSVKALVYAEGTFVRGRGEVINLEAVYDSTNIKVNDFLRLFMEEQLLVAKRAYRSLVVQLPTGAFGALGEPRRLNAQGAIVPDPVTP